MAWYSMVECMLRCIAGRVRAIVVERAANVHVNTVASDLNRRLIIMSVLFSFSPDESD